MNQAMTMNRNQGRMGNMAQTKRQQLYSYINRVSFAVNDITLYLDTHPDDAIAQADYLAYSEKLQLLITKYESQYGPLMNLGQSPTDVGSWVYQKWPWDL